MLPAIGLLLLVWTGPALAQGQGGYAHGCPGAETARMTSEERARAREMHQTNDTSGGRSSIDKSCKTWEGGGTRQLVPGSITWTRPDEGGDRSRGFGGAHVRR